MLIARHKNRKNIDEGGDTDIFEAEYWDSGKARLA